MTVPAACPVDKCRNPCESGVLIAGGAPESRPLFEIPLCDVHAELALVASGLKRLPE